MVQAPSSAIFSCLGLLPPSSSSTTTTSNINCNAAQLHLLPPEFCFITRTATRPVPTSNASIQFPNASRTSKNALDSSPTRDPEASLALTSTCKPSTTPFLQISDLPIPQGIAGSELNPKYSSVLALRSQLFLHLIMSPPAERGLRGKTR